MTYPKSLPLFYASLLEFIMTSKQGLMNLSKEYDLTFMQAITLLITDTDEPKQMNAFQKIFNCDASNVTGIVDGLEEKGLITRGEKPDDRRVKMILLTSKGADLQSKISTDVVTASDSFLATLSETERTQFRAIIEKLPVNSLF
jgi:DNA-binding MarR family transcriptional regulator